MRALVLAAGLGTRLHPLTLARAKAAASVDGEPLACRTIRWLVSQGFDDLVVNLHHKPESITAAVGDGSGLGARVRYSWESPVLGSAGGPRHALPLLLDSGGGPSRGNRADAQAATFVLVNGDTLTNVDLHAMIDFHRRSGALVTMALIPNPQPEKYGGVKLADSGAVAGFTKRRPANLHGDTSPAVSERQRVEGFHFIGPQVVEAEVFASLPDGVPSESVLGIYPPLIADRPGSVMGFVGDWSFKDIGTPADLLRTSLDLAAADGRPDRPRWGRGVRVDPSATVTRSVLWDNVSVGAGATLDACVVADGVTIPEGARYEHCAMARDGEQLVVVDI